jgi:hypothetical protein
VLSVENVAGHSASGSRSLALRYRHLAGGRFARAATATFIPPEAISMPGYMLLASPTLYPGQIVEARVEAAADSSGPVTCALYLRRYGQGDELVRVHGPEATLAPGETNVFTWEVPELDGQPIAEIGIELRSSRRAEGVVYLDYLTWRGTPGLTFCRPAEKGDLWRRTWVDGTDHYDRWWPEAYRVVVNSGTGALITGAREWTDYAVSTTLTPHLCERFGVAARVQGMRRYYALLLCRDGQARLVRALDGENVLAEAGFDWEFGRPYSFELRAEGERIIGSIDGRVVADVRDPALSGGGIALICTEGRVATDAVTVS